MYRNTFILWYLQFFCRYFVGLRSCIVVRDLDMLKQILVKQFDNFMDRPVCLDIHCKHWVWYTCTTQLCNKMHVHVLLIHCGITQYTIHVHVHTFRYTCSWFYALFLSMYVRLLQNSSSLIGVKIFKGVGIFAGKGDEWRSRRKILSKSFSAVKLNQV